MASVKRTQFRRRKPHLYQAVTGCKVKHWICTNSDSIGMGLTPDMAYTSWLASYCHLMFSVIEDSEGNIRPFNLDL